MQHMRNAQEVVTRFQTLRVGDRFIDHGGNVVEKIGERDVLIGPGYNGSLPIADYLGAIQAGETFGRYVVPGFNHAAFTEFSRG